MKEDLSAKEEDYSKIMKELTIIKDEGKDLYRKNQIEDAKKRFNDGYNYYTKIIKLEGITMDQYNELIQIYIKILSNLALCFYKQGNYKQSIIYDLKLISLDSHFAKSIVRLFNAYSKINAVCHCLHI